MSQTKRRLLAEYFNQLIDRVDKNQEIAELEPEE